MEAFRMCCGITVLGSPWNNTGSFSYHTKSSLEYRIQRYVVLLHRCNFSEPSKAHIYLQQILLLFLMDKGSNLSGMDSLLLCGKGKKGGLLSCHHCWWGNMKLEAECFMSLQQLPYCQEILCSCQSPLLFLELFVKVMLRICFF